MTGFGVTPVPLPVFWSTSQKEREQIRRRHQQPHFCQNRRCAANSAASSPPGAPHKVDSPKRLKRSSNDIIGGQKSRNSTVASYSTPTQTIVLERIMANYASAIERCAECNLPLEPRKSGPRSLRDTNGPRRVSKSDSNGSISQQFSKVYACSISIPNKIRKKPSAETNAPLSARSRNSSILCSSPRRASTNADTTLSCRTPTGIHGVNCRGALPDCSECSNYLAVSRCPSVEACASAPNCTSPSCPSAPHCSPVPDFPIEPTYTRISNFQRPTAQLLSSRESQISCDTDIPLERTGKGTPRAACLSMEDPRDSPESVPVVGNTSQLNKDFRAKENHNWCNLSTKQLRSGSFSPSCPVSPWRSSNRPSGFMGPTETPNLRRPPSFSVPRVTSSSVPSLECSNTSRRIFLTSGAVPSLSEDSITFKDNDFSSRSRQSQCMQSRCAASLPQRASRTVPSKKQTVSDATQMCLLEQRIEDEGQRSESSELITIFDDSAQSPEEICEGQLCSAFERVFSSEPANVRRVPVFCRAKEELPTSASRRVSTKDQKLRVALEMAVLMVMVTLLVMVFHPMVITGFTSYFHGCCSCPADSILATGIDSDTALSQIWPNNIRVYGGLRNLLKCPLAQQAMGSTVLK